MAAEVAVRDLPELQVHRGVAPISEDDVRGGAGVELAIARGDFLQRALASGAEARATDRDLARPPHDPAALLGARAPLGPSGEFAIFGLVASHIDVARRKLPGETIQALAAFVRLLIDLAEAEGQATPTRSGARLPVLPLGPLAVDAIPGVAALRVAWRHLLFFLRVTGSAALPRHLAHIPIAGLHASGAAARTTAPRRPIVPFAVHGLTATAGARHGFLKALGAARAALGREVREGTRPGVLPRSTTGAAV
mmetsp:Transcript_25045/g.69791  ORF Transcript_25045/g.69791 Transcript_25045/m.69791 type:complete len:252 (-) Transcript_25045:1068-1823(-)